MWVVLEGHEFAPHNRMDAYLLSYIGAVYAFAAVFLFLVTRHWTLRGAGQLGTLLADAGLYLSSGLIRLGWRDGPLSRGEANLIRALFLVCGTALLAGLLAWALGLRTRAPEPVEPEWNGEERRTGLVRRQADRERLPS